MPAVKSKMTFGVEAVDSRQEATEEEVVYDEAYVEAFLPELILRAKEFGYQDAMKQRLLKEYLAVVKLPRVNTRRVVGKQNALWRALQAYDQSYANDPREKARYAFQEMLGNLQGAAKTLPLDVRKGMIAKLIDKLERSGMGPVYADGNTVVEVLHLFGLKYMMQERDEFIDIPIEDHELAGFGAADATEVPASEPHADEQAAVDGSEPAEGAGEATDSRGMGLVRRRYRDSTAARAARPYVSLVA